MTVSPATTGNRAYALTELSAPYQFGRDIESGGLFVFDTATNTGTLLEDRRESVFSYVQSGLTMTLDIISSDAQSQSFTDSASGDTLTVTEAIDQYVLTLLEDGVGSDAVSVQGLGSVTTFNDTQNTIVSTEAIDEAFIVSVYDFSTQIPLNVEGQTRSLLTNVSTQIGTLGNGSDLQVDSLTFNADGTGFAAEKLQALTWIAQPDGHVSVVFADGEVADYYHLATRPSGDVIVTEYTDISGVNTATAELSFVKDPSAIWDADTLAGVYTARGTFALEDGTLVTDDAIYRLAPDGTGEVEFGFYDSSTGEQTPVTSSFGICWSVNITGELVVDRVLSRDAVVEGASRPNTSFCAATLPAEVSFRREQTLFDVSGVNIRTVTRESRNTCGFGPVGQQNCELLVDTYFPRIYELTETFVGDPPRAGTGRMESATGEAVGVAIEAFVLDSDSELDFSSIEIVKQPQTGTVSVDTSTGVITYTPVGDNSTDEFYYRVRDTDGNLSNVASVNVFIFAPVLVAPDVTANQSSLVTLDGSASTDNLGIVSYQWAQVSGTAVELTNANSSIASFTAPPRLIGLVEDLVFSLTVFDTDGLASVAEVQASISPATNGNKVFLLEENFAPWMEGSGIASIGLFNFDVDTNTGTLMPSVYTKENQSLAFNFAQDGLTLTVNFEGSGLVQDISTSFNDAFDEVTTTTRVNQAVLTLIEDGAGMDFAISQSIGNLTTFNETQTVEVSTVAFDTTDIVSIYELNGRVPLEVEGKTLSLLTNVSTQIDTLPDGGGFPGLQLDGLTFNQDGTGFAAEKSQSLLWTNDPNGYIRVVFSDGEVGEYYHVATGASGDVVVAAYTDVNDIAIAMAELSFTQDPTLIVDSSTVAGIYTSLYDLSSADFPEIYSYTTRLAPDGTGEVQYITVLESGELFSLTNTVGICWSFNDGGEFIADAVSSSQVVPGSNRPATEFCDSRLPKEGDLRYEKISYTNRQSVTRESEYFCSGELCAYQVNRLYASVTKYLETFAGDPPRAGSKLLHTNTGVPVDVVISSLVQDVDGSLDLTSIEIVIPPEAGSLSIDAVTGVITYTPTGTVAYTDKFAYQIRDDVGNLSNAALVDVKIAALDVTVSSSSLTPLSGELVTLSAGATESGVTYTWTQTGGTAVTLSDTTASSPTFIVSDVALLPTASVDERTFSVTVENADGETVVGEVVVTVDAVMPLAFFGVEESTIPIQYGVDLNPNRSFSVTMAADGASGVYGNGFGEFSFGANNLEDVGILEFTGLDGAVMHSYELDGYDENNDAVFDETIVFTDYAEELVFSLVIDGEGKDIVSVLERGVIKAFNATLGLPSTSQSDVAYTTTREFTIYDASSTIAFKINDEVRSLQTNIGAKVPTLRANRLFVDTLTFDSTSLTGSALKLDETFVWSVAIDGHLVVDFANGDEAEYYHLATRDTGDVVAVVYTEALGTPTRSNVNLSFTQTVPTWTNDIANHAGLYVDIEGFVDSAGNSNVFEYHFRVNPDGTGVEEFHSILSDGSESWSASDLAICARIDVSTEEMIWSRAHAGTQGESVDALSSMPLAGYCQSLTDSQISFQQAHTLFDVTSSGQYGMTLRQKSNTCGYFPVSDPKNCDLPGTLVTDDVYPRVMQYTAFANFPPVAIADAVTVFELTSTVIDVLANDLDGRNSALGANEPSGSVDLMDATTVEIIKQPTSGAATVDPNSGEITYTSDAGAISDVFYYRVKNVSGDSSNVGIVNVGIFALASP